MVTQVMKCVDFLDVLRDVKVELAIDTDEYKSWCTEELYNTSFFRLGSGDAMGYLDPEDTRMYDFDRIYNYLVDTYGEEMIMLWDY